MYSARKPTWMWRALAARQTRGRCPCQGVPRPLRGPARGGPGHGHECGASMAARPPFRRATNRGRSIVGRWSRGGIRTRYRSTINDVSAGARRRCPCRRSKCRLPASRWASAGCPSGARGVVAGVAPVWLVLAIVAVGGAGRSWWQCDRRVAAVQRRCCVTLAASHPLTTLRPGRAGKGA